MKRAAVVLFLLLTFGKAYAGVDFAGFSSSSLASVGQQIEFIEALFRMKPQDPQKILQYIPALEAAIHESGMEAEDRLINALVPFANRVRRQEYDKAAPLLAEIKSRYNALASSPVGASVRARCEVIQ